MSSSHTEKMGIFLQLYNLGRDEKTEKPNGTVEYKVVKAGSNEKVPEFSEAIAGSASEITLEKLLPLTKMSPGQYELKIRIIDNRRNQTLTPTASFTVI